MTTIAINLDEILQRIDAIKQEKAREKLILKQLEEEETKENLRLEAVLKQADVKNMDYGVYSFGWKETKRKAFDQKLFGESHPDLLEQFKIEKTIETFEVKINK